MNALRVKTTTEKQDIFKSEAVIHLSLLVFLAGFFGAVTSMVNVSPVYMIITCVTVVAFDFLLTNYKYKNALILGISALITVIIATIFNKSILDGIKLLFNNIFRLSEKAQPYKYEFFHNIGGGAKLGARIALTLAALLLSAALCCVTPKIKGITSFSLTAALILSCIYFAVLTSTVYFIITVIGVISLILSDSKRVKLSYVLPALLCTLVILTCVNLVLPNENGAVADIGNSLRDELAFETVYESGVTVEKTRDVTEISEDDENLVSQDEGEKKHIDIRVIIAVLLFAVISALLLIFSKLLERFNARRDSNTRDIDSDDNAKAVCAMFRYSVMLLKADGAKIGKSFSDIETAHSEQFKSDYRQELALFNEAAFSNHAINDAQREEMLDFMNRTKALIFDKANLKEKLLIKYRYAL